MLSAAVIGALRFKIFFLIFFLEYRVSYLLGIGIREECAHQTLFSGKIKKIHISNDLSSAEFGQTVLGVLSDRCLHCLTLIQQFLEA